jgi:hypothetical protein
MEVVSLSSSSSISSGVDFQGLRKGRPVSALEDEAEEQGDRRSCKNISWLLAGLSFRLEGTRDRPTFSSLPFESSTGVGFVEV